MYLVYPKEGAPIRVADRRLAEHMASRPGWRMEEEPPKAEGRRGRKPASRKE